jgi:hypothetical protein
MPLFVQALALAWVSTVFVWLASRKDLDRARGNPEKWDIPVQGRIVQLNTALVAVISVALLGAPAAWAFF